MCVFLDKRIEDALRGRNIVSPEKEIGIEIEVEGRGLPNVDNTFWHTKNDGSLQNGLEYLLKKPIKRNYVHKALGNLERAFHSADADIIPSVRTSTHVHVNVQDMTIRQVYTFLATYHALESLVTNYCSESRIGNLFSLRIRDSYGVIHRLHTAAKSKGVQHLGFGGVDMNVFRSMACNIASLSQFGTLEFRALDTSKDFVQRATKWVNIILKIKDASMAMRSPEEVIERTSFETPIGFARNVLGDDIVDELLALSIEKGCMNVEEEMWEDIRLVQDYVVFNNWE